MTSTEHGDALATGRDDTGREWHVRSVGISRWAHHDDIGISWSYADQPRISYHASSASRGLHQHIYDIAMAEPAVQAEPSRQTAELDAKDSARREEQAQRAVQEKAARAELDARIAECEASGTRIYVRFGDLPPGGHSYNHKDRRHEPGTSVYAAWRMPDGTIVLDLRGVDWISHIFSGFSERAIYLAQGRHVGTGSDGEPLLTDITLTPAGTDDYEMVG